MSRTIMWLCLLTSRRKLTLKTYPILLLHSPCCPWKSPKMSNSLLINQTLLKKRHQITLLYKDFASQRNSEFNIQCCKVKNRRQRRAFSCYLPDWRTQFGAVLRLLKWWVDAWQSDAGDGGGRDKMLGWRWRGWRTEEALAVEEKWLIRSRERAAHIVDPILIFYPLGSAY